MSKFGVTLSPAIRVVSVRHMPMRFAAAFFALAVQASTAALPLEYILALESDDTCLPGASSCSLALSQLRASARGRQSSSSEKPVLDYAFEEGDADLALLASGVPSRNAAATISHKSFQTSLTANQVTPALLPSELPWAAVAAHEAEQKVAEATQVEPQATTLSKPQAQARAQPQDQAQPQGQTQPETQPAVQPQLQPQSQPQARSQASRAASQPIHRQFAPHVPPQDAQLKAPPAAPQAAPQEEPQAAPEVAMKAVPPDGRALSLNSSHEDVDGDDVDVVGDEERRLLGVDSYTMSDLVAMAGEKGAEVLWDAAALSDARASDNASEDAPSTKLAHPHHSAAFASKSKMTRTNSTESLFHGEAHHSTGTDKHSHSESQAIRAAQDLSEGHYIKAAGGYDDVVLSRPTVANHYVHMRTPVSLSSEKGQKFHRGMASKSKMARVAKVIAEYEADSRDGSSANDTHNRSEVESKVNNAVDRGQGFVGRLRAFNSHPLWIESCTQILLDVGTGQGNNIKALYEPESVNSSLKFMLTLQQVFKLPEDRRLPSAQSGLCALGMEPNPKYHRQLHELKKEYKARGWNVHFYPFAAWGSSVGLLSMSGSTVSSARSGSYKTAAEVMSVGLPDFMRSLPPSVGVSMLILDVEGSESELLPSLLSERILCQSVTRSALIFGSPKDIVKRERAQRCGGKVTPVVDLAKYLA